MTAQEIDAEVIGERRHLLSLAFRMLGIVAGAEDAVQETYNRWYGMGRAPNATPSRSPAPG
jgi:DNA-directed RNA polymerase specialized sigma24 family protein